MSHFIPTLQEESESSLQAVHEKSSKFHSLLRQKHIQSIKSKIRLQHTCQQTLTNLLSNLPSSLPEIHSWCQSLLTNYTLSPSFQLSPIQTLQLYTLITKFPCLQTLQLLNCIVHRISIVAIHQLFQHDIVGLLHGLMGRAEKLVPVGLWGFGQGEGDRDRERDRDREKVEIVRVCMRIIAGFCQRSQKAKNFMVMTHKTYLHLKKSRSEHGPTLNPELTLCLYTFTLHKLLYNEQYIRIIRHICLQFCTHTPTLQLPAQQLVLLIKGMTAVVRCREKWAMELIQDLGQYDVVEAVLAGLRGVGVRGREEGEREGERGVLRQLGQIAHQLTLFLINYIQISTNPYFPWQSFLPQFFTLLTLPHPSHPSPSPQFQHCRQDIYFIFNNILCDSEPPQSEYHGLRSAIFERRCLQVFEVMLEREVGEDVLQELGYCVHSLVCRVGGREGLGVDMGGLVRAAMELVTRNFYPCNTTTKQTLIMAMIELLNRTEEGPGRDGYRREIKEYEGKLNAVCMLYAGEGRLMDAMESLLGIVVGDGEGELGAI